MAINYRLQRLRIQRNWRQEDLAEQLGVHVTTVQRWEHGSHYPTPYYRVKLCTLFETNAQVLGLSEEEPQSLSPQRSSDDTPSVSGNATSSTWIQIAMACGGFI